MTVNPLSIVGVPATSIPIPVIINEPPTLGVTLPVASEVIVSPVAPFSTSNGELVPRFQQDTTALANDPVPLTVKVWLLPTVGFATYPVLCLIPLAVARSVP